MAKRITSANIPLDQYYAKYLVDRNLEELVKKAVKEKDFLYLDPYKRHVSKYKASGMSKHIGPRGDAHDLCYLIPFRLVSTREMLEGVLLNIGYSPEQIRDEGWLEYPNLVCANTYNAFAQSSMGKSFLSEAAPVTVRNKGVMSEERDRILGDVSKNLLVQLGLNYENVVVGTQPKVAKKPSENTPRLFLENYREITRINQEAAEQGIEARRWMKVSIKNGAFSYNTQTKPNGNPSKGNLAIKGIWIFSDDPDAYYTALKYLGMPEDEINAYMAVFDQYIGKISKSTVLEVPPPPGFQPFQLQTHKKPTFYPSGATPSPSAQQTRTNLPSGGTRAYSSNVTRSNATQGQGQEL